MLLSGPSEETSLFERKKSGPITSTEYYYKQQLNIQTNNSIFGDINYRCRRLYVYQLGDPAHHFVLTEMSSLNAFNRQLSKMYANMTSLTCNPFNGVKFNEVDKFVFKTLVQKMKMRFNEKINREFEG